MFFSIINKFPYAVSTLGRKACLFYWWFWFFTFLGKLYFKAKGEEVCLNANCHLNCCEYTNEFEARRESETAFAFIWSSDFIKLSKMTRAYRGSFFSYNRPFTKMSWEKFGEVKKKIRIFLENEEAYHHQPVYKEGTKTC